MNEEFYERIIGLFGNYTEDDLDKRFETLSIILDPDNGGGDKMLYSVVCEAYLFLKAKFNPSIGPVPSQKDIFMAQTRIDFSYEDLQNLARQYTVFKNVIYKGQTYKLDFDYSSVALRKMYLTGDVMRFKDSIKLNADILDDKDYGFILDDLKFDIPLSNEMTIDSLYDIALCPQDRLTVFFTMEKDFTFTIPKNVETYTFKKKVIIGDKSSYQKYIINLKIKFNIRRDISSRNDA